ncbi:MAG TPA: efflux RND transporter periplasmic adaptor subunit [Oligoflexia bacterium]|nr:efflux RND transporter periplasmic adaptor subunit [Oligoflexia bacterium]HMP49066.1 efflux RND transporter periplasmic adaptor subunit [Oligoflexia bacterium]
MVKFFLRLWIGAIPVLILVAILGTVKAFQIKAAIAQGKLMGPPPIAVTTMKVENSDWNQVIRAVGSIEAARGSMLSAESSGRVDEIPLKDGSPVKARDLIIGLDASVELAEYEASKAQMNLLKKTFERQKKLFEAKAISAEEYDTALLNLKERSASTDALMARVLRKQIRAPFDGVLGVRRVNEGQYVKEGDPLIPLYDMSEMYFSFSLSQNDVSRISIGDKAEILLKELELSVPALITAIDPAISPVSKISQVKAQILDTNEKIRPGMFASIEIALPYSDQVIVIPTTAIKYAPFGDSVFVLEKKDPEKDPETIIANPSFIEILDRRGDMVAVKKGLSKGSEIVTSGTFKLSPGAVVIINNSVSPDMNLNPSPINR